MSLSRITTRSFKPTALLVRYAATLPKLHHEKPVAEKGFLAWTKDWSRDRNLVKTGHPPQRNLPSTFFFETVNEHPMVYLLGSWFIAFGVVSFWAFNNVETWLDHKEHATFAAAATEDWDTVHKQYWKHNSLRHDIGRTHQPEHTNAYLQQQMKEAGIKGKP